MSTISKRDLLKSAAAVGAVSVVPWSGFANAQAAQQHLRAQTTPLNSIDPARQVSAGDEGRISALVNSALLRYAPGPKFELQPDLATGYEVNDGGKVYTFRLRRGVKWHGNHGEFTARDVKFSIERILNPETKSVNAGQMRAITSMDIVDDYTIRFNLSAPSAIFPHSVSSFRGGYIVSEAAFKAQGEDATRKIIGTGPFAIENVALDREITLVRNNDYFGEKPKLDRITFTMVREESTAMLAFDRGQIDIVDIHEKEIIDRYSKDQRVNFLVADVTTGLYVLTFNTQKPPFDKKEVRQAFAYAINKQEMVAAVYGPRGDVLNTVVPPGVEGFTTDLPTYAYDPARAQKMLADAGVKELNCTLTVPTSYQREAVIIQAQLKKAGINLNLKLIDRPTWFRSLAGTDHEILWNAAFRAPVADAFLYPGYHSSNIAPKGINCAMYSGIDDLLDKARVTLDAKEREALYIQALKKLADDMPAVPLTVERNAYIIQKRVAGLGSCRVPENAPVLERASITG